MENNIEGMLRAARKPLVGIGPMSRNCVDTIYRYSHEQETPILMIASRRQIETARLGRGYVNNWTTEEFSAYLRPLKERWNRSRVVVCRDHGGPWQGGAWEKTLSLKEAMNNALTNYCADIDTDFDLLHIDPSVTVGEPLELETIVERAQELFVKCQEHADRKGKKIMYEIGTEEIDGKTTDPASFEGFLKSIRDFCVRNTLPTPVFIVGQTGSRIKEMRQLGNFTESNTRKLIQICELYGVLLKEHSADYLSEHQLSLRRKIGVHALNVAPELGVIESKAFMEFCEKEKRPELVARFLELALASKRWDKWVIDERHISDYDKALIAGHYVFATPEFQKLRAELDTEKLDKYLCGKLYERIDFYCGKR